MTNTDMLYKELEVFNFSLSDSIESVIAKEMKGISAVIDKLNFKEMGFSDKVSKYMEKNKSAVKAEFNALLNNSYVKNQITTTNLSVKSYKDLMSKFKGIARSIDISNAGNVDLIKNIIDKLGLQQLANKAGQDLKDAEEILIQFTEELKNILQNILKNDGTFKDKLSKTNLGENHLFLALSIIIVFSLIGFIVPSMIQVGIGTIISIISAGLGLVVNIPTIIVFVIVGILAIIGCILITILFLGTVVVNLIPVLRWLINIILIPIDAIVLLATAFLFLIMGICGIIFSISTITNVGSLLGSVIALLFPISGAIGGALSGLIGVGVDLSPLIAMNIMKAILIIYNSLVELVS